MKNRPRRTFNLVFIMVAIGYPVLFCILLNISGSLNQTYDPIRQSISVLALGTAGWLHITNMLLSGIAIFCFALALHLDIGSYKGSRLVLTFLLIMGLGDIVGAIFMTDLPDQTISLHGFLHQVGTGTAISMFPIAAIILWYLLKPDLKWHKFSIYTLVSGIVVMGLEIGRQVSVPTHWLDPIFGLYVRILLAVLFLWIEVISINLLVAFRARYIKTSTLPIRENNP